MSEKYNIEELVRSKLDRAEITPSPEAWKGVQRQLRLKRFMRFDPRHFNLYYLGGLVVAGVLALTLSTGEKADEEFKPLAPAPSSQTAEASLQENERAHQEQGFIDSEMQESVSAEKKTEAAVKSKEDKTAEQNSAPEQGVSENEPEEKEGNLKQEGALRGNVQAVQQTLVTYFTGSALSGCAPLHVSFVNSSVNATSYSWSFGTGEVSTETNPHYTFTEAGSYTVTLRSTGKAGLSELYSQVVEVYPVPEAAFEIEEGLVGVDGVETLELMNYSTGAFSYAWDLPGQKNRILNHNEFQPILKTKDLPGEARMLRLVAENSQGCTDTSVVEIPAIAGSAARELIFPTAFNANHTGPTGGSYNPNDMKVDVFHPHFTEVPGVYHLQVFSRMGELVFESHDIYMGWDGYVREERAAGGVYLWVVEGTWENGEVFSQKGDVTLLWSDRRWP